MAEAISELRIVPHQAAPYLLRIRIEQQLIFVETQSLARIIRAVHSISVKLSGTSFRKIAMPNLVSLLRHYYAMCLVPPPVIEQTQLDSFRPFRKEGEVHPLAIPVCAKRVWFARPDDCPSLVCHLLPSEESLKPSWARARVARLPPIRRGSLSKLASSLDELTS